MVQPDLILADYNLPNGMNGAVVAAMIREELGRPVPAIILTGDISAGIASTVAFQHCVQLNKPVKLQELTQTIQHLLPLSQAVAHAPRHGEDAGGSGPPVIYVVDDDDSIRGAIRAVLEDDDRNVEDYETCEAFLAAFRPGRAACLVIDAYLPGMNGITLLRRLREAGHALPAIMITGNSDVAIAVEAMKAGASDFIEKPISRIELLASVDHALERSRDSGKLSAWRNDAASRVASLTPRQRQIMDMVLAGHPSKNIAADLGISQRTVENHRASIMAKTDTKSLPALARMAIAAVDG
jgi:two-component system CheB/CheR fusion protein